MRSGRSSIAAPTADRLGGRAALAGNRPAEALGPLEVGAAGFASLDMAVDAAAVRLDVAEALLALGRSDEAHAAAATAHELFQRVGHAREAACASPLLSSAGS